MAGGVRFRKSEYALKACDWSHSGNFSHILPTFCQLYAKSRKYLKPERDRPVGGERGRRRKVGPQDGRALQGGSNHGLAIEPFLGWHRRIRLAATENRAFSRGGFEPPTPRALRDGPDHALVIEPFLGWQMRIRLSARGKSDIFQGGI